MPSRLLKAVAFALLLAVGLTGTGAVAEDAAGERTFYLRGQGCGDGVEAFALSTRAGEDDYEGCGGIYGLPFNEIYHHIWGPETKVGTTRDGVPVTLDASRDLVGQVQAEAWFDEDVPGVGQVVVDVLIEGVDEANQRVAIGTAHEEAIVAGERATQVPFTIDVGDALDGQTLKAMTMYVTLHGANFNSGNLGLSGDTRFTLPIVLPSP